MTGKKMSLRTKAILLITVFMLTSYLALGGALISQTRTAMKDQIDERMLDIVNTAAAMLDGDVLDRLTAEDKGTPEYEMVYATLAKFLDNINLDYIYYVKDAGNKTFTFGIDPDPVAPGEFGAQVVYTDALYAASQGVPSVDGEPYEDDWGRFYSAFSPVFNSEGEVAGVVSADFNADWYENQINHGQRTILIGCGLFIIIGVVITIILTSQYNRQMEMIKKNVGELAEDLELLTVEYAEDIGNVEVVKDEPEPRIDLKSTDMQTLGKRISRLQNDLRHYITHSTTQANSMITAMASDYRCVYHVNLDENDGVCYRNDPNDKEQTPRTVNSSNKKYDYAAYKKTAFTTVCGSGEAVINKRV